MTLVHGKVLIQGGYDTNYGVIFKGNIRRNHLGRESATDTFMDLNCGDGAFAYNYAFVNYIHSCHHYWSDTSRSTSSNNAAHELIWHYYAYHAGS